MQIKPSSADEQLQRSRKIRWLWGPTGTLLVVGLLLLKLQPGWGVLGLGLAALWALLASLSFGLLEGLRLGGSDWLGYGPDIRSVGVFAAYRKRSTMRLLVAAYLLLGLVGLLTPRLPADQVEGGFLLVALQFVLASAPLDMASWCLARYWGDWPPLRARLALWLPAALLGLLFNELMLDVMTHAHPELVFPIHRWLGAVIVLGYLLVTGGVHQLATRWQGRIDQANQRADEADTARRLAEAQLAVLQAQIEPHFLYNTLATVQYLVRGEPAAAEYLLNQLIRYLRLAMPSMRSFSSTLGREFELTDAYLQIARMRMGGRLTVDLDLLSELHEHEFPTLLLQTLVENAIKHGVEPKPGPVHIQIYARRDGAGLEVGVRDNGVGLGHSPSSGGGTGLQNIRERLAQIYGPRARLTVSGLAQGGVLAQLQLQAAS